MDDFGPPRFEGIVNTIRKKRSQSSRRPRPESQSFPESHDRSPLSSTPSDDLSKVSSDENGIYDANARRKVLNVNDFGSRVFPALGAEGDYPHKNSGVGVGVSNMQQYENGGSGEGAEQGQGELFNENNAVASSRNSGGFADGVGSDNKLKKVKLKVGGVIRTIQTKSSSNSGGSDFTKNSQPTEAPRQRRKLILQDNPNEDSSPPRDKKSGLQGIPWKDFSSRGGFSLRKEESSSGGSMPEKNTSGKHGEKSDRVRKSKRVPKRRPLDDEFSEDYLDDEDRYLEKQRTTFKVVAGLKDTEDESSKKQRSLSRISKGGKLENMGDDKKSRSERSEDTDYVEDEDLASDGEADEKKRKKQRKDSSDSPTESKRETTLTMRQRALLSGKDSSLASGRSLIEFPNGLPPAPPKKQKEKLSEVEQQLKKAEAAQRRKLQSQKAAQESQAEAIRKILGQDSSRKKREDKVKKRQEELAQEKAAYAQTLASNTVRWVMGPTGTIVTFPDDMGFPHIFDHKSSSYPVPRERCAGPACMNPYKYRDSKSKLPLCSLRCYKAVHEKMQVESAC